MKKNGWSTTRKVHVHLKKYFIWHCLNLKLHSQTSKPFGIIDDREPRLQKLGLRHVTEEFLEDLNPPFGGNNFIITSNSTQLYSTWASILEVLKKIQSQRLRIEDRRSSFEGLATLDTVCFNTLRFLWAHCFSCVYAVIWLPTNA